MGGILIISEICCSYSNDRNILKIVYCYRVVNKRSQKDFYYSNYLKDGTILMTMIYIMF